MKRWAPISIFILMFDIFSSFIFTFQVALIQQRLYNASAAVSRLLFDLFPLSFFEIRPQKHQGPPFHIRKKRGLE